MHNCYNLTCKNLATVRVVHYGYKDKPYILGHSCDYHTYKNKIVGLKKEAPIREEPRYLACKNRVV